MTLFAHEGATGGTPIKRYVIKKPVSSPEWWPLRGEEHSDEFGDFCRPLYSL